MATTLTSTGITFPDATTQTTAASAPSTTHGDVGTYAFVVCVNTTSVTAGSTVTGDKLRYNWSAGDEVVRDGSSTYNGGGTAYSVSTTWRKMGGGYTYLAVPRPENTTLYYWYPQLWVRVS